MNYFLILCGGGLVSCTANTCTWDAHLRCEIFKKRDCFTFNVLFNLIGFWTSQIKIFSLCGMSNQNFLSLGYVVPTLRTFAMLWYWTIGVNRTLNLQQVKPSFGFSVLLENYLQSFRMFCVVKFHDLLMHVSKWVLKMFRWQIFEKKVKMTDFLTKSGFCESPTKNKTSKVEPDGKLIACGRDPPGQRCVYIPPGMKLIDALEWLFIL